MNEGSLAHRGETACSGEFFRTQFTVQWRSLKVTGNGIVAHILAFAVAAHLFSWAYRIATGDFAIITYALRLAGCPSVFACSKHLCGRKDVIIYIPGGLHASDVITFDAAKQIARPDPNHERVHPMIDTTAYYPSSAPACLKAL
jgi:hypothetical protein